MRTVQEDGFHEVMERAPASAREAFERHEITKVADGHYLCMRPKADKSRAFYWFRVLFVPYYVVILGDIGESVYFISDADSLAWTLGFRDNRKSDLDYMLGKVRNPDLDFYEADARRYMTELGDESPIKSEKMLDDWENEEPSAEAYARVWYENGGDECPSATKPAYGEVFRAAAVQWFAVNYGRFFQDEARDSVAATKEAAPEAPAAT